MDALDQLTNNYNSSAGSGGFNRPANPSISKFDDNEGGDILKVYGGRGGNEPGFGYGRPSHEGGYMDDFSQNSEPHFGIDRQRHNYERATNFINNDMQRPYTGGQVHDDTASFDKYSAHGQGRRQEGFEDILDSLKGDIYERRDEESRFGGRTPGMTRPHTGPNKYASGYDESRRRDAGPISVGTRSIPDLDRSRPSSREDDIRSIQPQNLGGANQPSWSRPGSYGARGVSTGEDKRRSKYRNDDSPGSNIDVIETPVTRRTRTAQPRKAPQDKVDVPKYNANKKPIFLESDNRPMSKPPLHRPVSMMDDDDRLSQYKVRDDIKSNRPRHEPDNISDITSRRRGFGADDSFRADQQVPALDSSNSRRGGRYIQAKTPGFKREEEDSFKARKVSRKILIFNN